jgi:hypothetical protein
MGINNNHLYSNERQGEAGRLRVGAEKESREGKCRDFFETLFLNLL